MTLVIFGTLNALLWLSDLNWNNMFARSKLQNNDNNRNHIVCLGIVAEGTKSALHVL